MRIIFEVAMLRLAMSAGVMSHAAAADIPVLLFVCSILVCRT